MHGKRAAVVQRYPVIFSLCAVFSCFHTAGSFTTDGYGIVNMRTHLGACRTHEEGSGTNKSAQEWARRDRKTIPRLASPGDRTQGQAYKQDYNL